MPSTDYLQVYLTQAISQKQRAIEMNKRAEEMWEKAKAMQDSLADHRRETRELT